MTPNYNRVWTTMNELEMVTSKISSAREILDSAIDALENHNGEKAETLMYAADEFLKYYLADFDAKFKDAWNETVVKLKREELSFDGWTQDTPKVCDKKEDKVIKWRLPVEMDGPSGEYFVTFPDDLLEAANLNEGDEVEWVDQNDGSFILRKTWNDPYKDDMIAAGYKKVDGVWTREVEPLKMDEC
jgi:hypothetical protein